MPLGPGKYDSELTEVRVRVGATSAVLIVLDGVRGPGFACQTTLEHLNALPEALEYIARQMREDRKKV